VLEASRSAKKAFRWNDGSLLVISSAFHAHSVPPLPDRFPAGPRAPCSARPATVREDACGLGTQEPSPNPGVGLVLEIGHFGMGRLDLEIGRDLGNGLALEKVIHLRIGLIRLPGPRELPPSLVHVLLPCIHLTSRAKGG
jgi:hypothetical protein